MTAVDSSRPALEVAEQNEQLNRDAHTCGEIEWIEANAFDLLKDYSTAGQQYDTIVLDPPAFAKTKRVVETALRGYKELNLRALKMLRPGRGAGHLLLFVPRERSRSSWRCWNRPRPTLAAASESWKSGVQPSTIRSWSDVPETAPT